MSQHPRGSSFVPVASPDSIPRAPPLPAPRPLQRARDAAYRIFGTPSRPPSPIQERYDRFTQGGIARYASLGATQNATASHKTGLEINTIAINEQGTHALIGGKEIFKTVKVEDGVCAEEFNLRTAIRSTPTQASGRPRQVYSIEIADVAWAKGDCGDYVAAATSSGKIILYDLGHAGLQAAQLHQHYRQVHKVTFNPHRGNLLLSGSQDGTVRLWDLRDVRSQVTTLQSKRKYSGQSDGVRDVKWSPTEGVDFALGTDSGCIQRWDMRNLKTAKVKIPAHSLSCNTIDWHPDGKHLVSASSDKSVRVWDFSTSRRQQKASWEIKTPYPVLNARWRPACESSMPFDNGARQCTQLVAAYDREHAVLHIWDFRRPSLPFREMTPYPSAPTDLLWHSQDLLWTVGREGVYLQSDIQHAPRVIDKRNLQAFAISPTSEINIAVQRRGQKRSRKKLPPPPPQQQQQSLQTNGSSFSQSPEHSFLSRSWADDCLDHSFLSVSSPKGRRRTGSKGREASVSATPPWDGSKVPTVRLDDILLNRISFRPEQTAVRGFLLGTQDKEAFEVLAKSYSKPLMVGQGAAFIEVVDHAFKSNARLAKRAGFYRLAQTWKILGFATVSHLKQRISATGKMSSHVKLRLRKEKARSLLGDVGERVLAGTTTTSPSVAPVPISNLTQALAILDSTSNVTTPLIRPQDTSSPRGAFFDPKGITIPPRLEKHDSNESFEFLAESNSKAPYLASMSDAEVRYSPPARRISGSLSDDDDSLHGLVGAYSEYDTPALSGVPTRRCSPEQPFRLEAAMKHRERSPTAVEHALLGLNAISEKPKQTSLPPAPPLPSPPARAGYISDDDDDIDVETNSPFTLQAILNELVTYYSNTLPSAQTAAHLLLLVEPLLPRTHSLTSASIAATVAAYTDYLTSTGWEEDDTAELIDDLFSHPILAGLQPLQTEAVLATYHEQLMAQQLFDEAAQLRRMAYPQYPAVYEQALTDVSINAERAGEQALCPVCRCEESPVGATEAEEGSEGSAGSGGGTEMWSACLVCVHGGHVACLRAVFADDSAACPTEGCLCNCGAGER